MSEVISDMESGRRLKYRQSCKVAKGYVLSIESALSRLKTFEKQSHRRYSLDDVDMNFQRQFIANMVKNGLKPNTIKTRLASVHVIMREAYIRGLTDNDGYKNPEFIPLAEPVENVYLTEDQLEQIERLEMEELRKRVGESSVNEKMMKSLEQTRDLFLMGCMTGQRFSDYSRIDESMVVRIAGYRFLSLKQKKTGGGVLIPMNNKMERLLERYNGRMPKIALATFNKNIRVIGEALEWTWRPDSVSGNVRFCDMLSSHTARRSFATNAYQRGVPLKSIMAVTGHRSERSIRLYLKLDARDKAIMAARDFSKFLDIEAIR